MSNDLNISYNPPKELRENLKAKIYQWAETQKNFNRLNSLAVGECSNRCLSNFKSKSLDNKEIICMTNCLTKFYDVYDLGENVYSSLSSGKVDLSGLRNGDINSVMEKL